MTPQMFLMLLSTFSIITGLVVEVIKKIVSEKVKLSYNLTALITAIVIGGAGTGTYYYLTDIPFTGKNIVFMILLGLASGITSMVGFDKVKGIFVQLGLIKEDK